MNNNGVKLNPEELTELKEKFDEVSLAGFCWMLPGNKPLLALVFVVAYAVNCNFI